MANVPADSALSLTDQRLVSALQCDGRLTAERAAQVLGLGAATVRRRLHALTADGTVRVVVSPVARPRNGGSAGALFLRIRVLRGKLDTIVAALAAREDIPFIDVTTAGDEIFAVARTEPGSRDPLVFRQLPSTQAVTSLESATILHVFRLTSEWRHTVLSPAERTALSRTDPQAEPATERVRPSAGSPGPYGVDTDPVEQSLIDALTPDARLPAAALAARTGHPETTVRRRVAQLTAHRGQAAAARGPRPPGRRRTGPGRPPSRPRRVCDLRPLEPARRRILPRSDRALRLPLPRPVRARNHPGGDRDREPRRETYTAPGRRAPRPSHRHAASAAGPRGGGEGVAGGSRDPRRAAKDVPTLVTADSATTRAHRRAC
jgi:DNA-binding Lrp family transcriptional regulator